MLKRTFGKARKSAVAERGDLSVMLLPPLPADEILVTADEAKTMGNRTLR